MAQAARLAAVHVVPHPAGGWLFGVVAKRTYRVTDAGCVPAEEQLALVEGPRLTPDSAGLVHDSDLLLGRALADVVVQGHAYGPDGAATFDAAVRVDGLHRRVKVFGNRCCERDPRGELRFTPPGPAPKVPLGWESAYGGLDAVAHKLLGAQYAESFQKLGINPDPRFFLFGYPRNPLGKGYLIEPTPDALDACALPNLEGPARLLTPQTLPRKSHLLWPQGPPVAGFGWLNYNVFPRSVQLGLAPPLYDVRLKPQDFPEVAAGWLRPEVILPKSPVTQRLDPGVMQASAVGLRLESASPWARVELTHLHPKKQQWAFTLNGDVPRLTFRLPGERPVEGTPKIRTLLLEPDKDRVVVVWTAEQRVAHPIKPELLAKVEHAVEWRGEGAAPRMVAVPAVPPTDAPAAAPPLAPAVPLPAAAPTPATTERGLPTAKPAAASAAPPSVTVPADVVKVLGDLASAGPEVQRGGVLVQGPHGQVTAVVQEGRGQALSFKPAPAVNGQALVGAFHTHPDPAGGVAFSAGDVAAMLNTGGVVEVVRSGPDVYLLLRSQRTPASAPPDQVQVAYDAVLRRVLGEGKSFAEATQAAAGEMAQQYHLALYHGRDANLKRIRPA